ncbi:ABC transporter transmembrane region family protein [Bacillus clarus]|uniref:ABC transporter transmembrane region family protein n=1 Tax=Bacillus clarus TaxID=2338372 RepID=A0A090YXZ8_9BACI|nr:ABC transporter transmembrane region family protein [Bacillus clarus]
MNEYKRILLPLLQEKVLLITALYNGIFAAVMNLSRTLLMGVIVDRLIQGSLKEVYICVSLFVASRFMAWTNTLLFDYISAKTSQRILQTKRMELLRHFLSLPFEESERVKQGELETLVVSDIPNWVKLYGSTLVEYIHAIAQFIGALIAFRHIDTQFIWWVIPFLILSAIIPMFMTKKTRKLASIAQKNHSSVVETISQFVKGIQDLRSLGKEKW